MSSEQTRNLADELMAAVQPLLELFATVDGVFTEDDAMQPAKLQVGMGRIYRQWKKTRTELGGDE